MRLSKLEKSCKAVGVDEVGLGSLAGPVVAAAAYAKDLARIARLYTMSRHKAYTVDDSKALPREIRERLLEKLMREDIVYALGVVEASEINEMRNIYKAGMLARRRAIQNFLATGTEVDLFLIDGNFKDPELNVPYVSVVGGDAKVVCIAFASIIAKVFRDDLMATLAKVYPGYGWETNAGYRSPKHLRAIVERGLTPLHRLHFADVKRCLDTYNGTRLDILTKGGSHDTLS